MWNSTCKSQPIYGSVCWVPGCVHRIWILCKRKPSGTGVSLWDVISKINNITSAILTFIHWSNWVHLSCVYEVWRHSGSIGVQKQWDSGHVGVPNWSWTFFLCKQFHLFQWMKTLYFAIISQCLQDMATSILQNRLKQPALVMVTSVKPCSSNALVGDCSRSEQVNNTFMADTHQYNNYVSAGYFVKWWF